MSELRGVQLISVIRVSHTRGAGVESDPVRIVTEYYSPKGELLAENDPCAELKAKAAIAAERSHWQNECAKLLDAKLNLEFENGRLLASSLRKLDRRRRRRRRK